jgi:hypothetical protein
MCRETYIFYVATPHPPKILELINLIKDSIFIPIAACEERFIEQTVKSALLNAENPDNIYFGIFNNILNKDHSLLNNEFLLTDHRIFYVEVITPAPMGTGFGRMNASLLQFKNFDYMFQIDAHTFFSKNWDTQLINVFNKIKDQENIDENKLILSASSGFMWTYYDEDPEKVYAVVDHEKKIFEIDPLNLEKNAKDLVGIGMTNLKFVYDGKQNQNFNKDTLGFPIVYGDHYLEEEEYKESGCVHATFMFSKAKLTREVMHDPEDHFHGDQTNYSIRLLSRGYRIFSPKYPTIATLNKGFVSKEFINKPLKQSHDWRIYEPNQVGSNYLDTKITNSKINFNQIISGKYFGYWGTTDNDSLNKVKEQINYPSEDSFGIPE